MSEVTEVSLDTLAGGAAVERFNYEEDHLNEDLPILA